MSLVGAAKVQDILDKINNATGNGGKLVASFDEAKQQFVFTDKTTPTEATSAATSVTQTGSPVFYGREGGTAVAAPKSGAATDDGPELCAAGGDAERAVLCDGGGGHVHGH